MTDINATLEERGRNYGSFPDHADISQSLKIRIRSEVGWVRLCPDQQEALEMIMHKIARIINGNPHFHDSWHDICGYAKLVADRLEGKEKKP